MQFWSSLNSLYCNVWLVAMVTPTSNFAQCPCSIQTLYCDNRSPSHYIIRFFHYATRSILVLNGLKSRLLICASLLLTTNISCFLVFSFQAELAQNKNNIDIASYEFLTKTSRLGVGVRRMPRVCTQSCIRLSRVLRMLTEWIRERYRDYYVIGTFNNG